MSLELKSLHFSQSEKLLLCHLRGDWVLETGTNHEVENYRKILSQVGEGEKCKFYFDTSNRWDSSLLVFLLNIESRLLAKGIEADFSELPPKIQSLIALAKERASAIQYNRTDTSVKHYDRNLSFYLKLTQVSTFWGKWLLSVFKFFTGRSFLRFGDLLSVCRDCGASALPIITLIAFLTGLTMAFVGSVQLEKFNATIYVADLVSLAMVREMGALMVAIVMAGRTGAAFAAELGSMKIREELDSLRTFGIPAMEFLVLPRTIALFVMTPLLTLYADVVGILGGLMVGTQVMDLSLIHI